MNLMEHSKNVYLYGFGFHIVLIFKKLFIVEFLHGIKEYPQLCEKAITIPELSPALL